MLKLWKLEMARAFSHLKFHSNQLHPGKWKPSAKKVIHLFHVWSPSPKYSEQNTLEIWFKQLNTCFANAKLWVQTSVPKNKTNKQGNNQDQDDHMTDLILTISMFAYTQILSYTFFSLYLRPNHLSWLKCLHFLLWGFPPKVILLKLHSKLISISL
jgi:hypothetical protein